ncbi:hypothetical protein [Variibacter gotjawalensis]|nr:hypothetical protein [Variibacter gotjawalensis]NIK45837.1 hypothetical protein [Variibacter gotjawalensis]
MSDTPNPLVASPFLVQLAGEHVTVCECCEDRTQVACGLITTRYCAKIAWYWVRWTIGKPSLPAVYDIAMVPPSVEPYTHERVLVEMGQFFEQDGGVAFGDADRSPLAKDTTVCDRALTRDEALMPPFVDRACDLFDTIWINDPRLGELRTWRENAKKEG